MIDVNELDAYIKNQWDNDPSDWGKQEDFFHSLSATQFSYRPRGPVEVGPYKLTLVWDEGGPSDSGGNDCWNFVFKVDGSDQLFKIDTDYDSYEGTEWHGSVYECEPYIEPVTKYRRKS